MKTNEKAIGQMSKILEIFKASEGEIRPHCIITGPSGSGKTFTLTQLCENMEINLIEVNAAQLTKEGMSGNSLSKALAAGITMQWAPFVVLVDEFDKLFLSGNNHETAHEVTTGVQNEFLKVLESDTTQIYGDYGKYVTMAVNKCLFIFMGAFNGMPDLDVDKLREIGVKTEFLGRAGLVYNMQKVSLEEMLKLVDDSILLKKYRELFPKEDHNKAVRLIKAEVRSAYENNTLGARLINSLVHQYYINGGLTKKVAATTSFSRKLSFAQGAAFDKN